VAAFYARVLGLTESARDNDHVLLETPGLQLIVHRMVGGDVPDADPPNAPARRARAAFKPVFVVSSLAETRAVVDASGGAMEPLEREWSYRGARVCDAIDPEGNVVQFHVMPTR
jgi:predicted enzyme related to lactoylglutathione lyase